MAQYRSHPGIGAHTHGVAHNRAQSRRGNSPGSINRYRGFLPTGQRGDRGYHLAAHIHGIERAAPMMALDRS